MFSNKGSSEMSWPLQVEVEKEAARLEGRAAEEILGWAAEAYGERLAVSVSFGGAEGMVLLDMLSRITDKATVLSIDTGFLFPETVRFREEVMAGRYKELRLEVLRTELSIEEQVARYGAGLYGCRPDTCCRIRKVEPMRRAMVGEAGAGYGAGAGAGAGYGAWVTGIRRDQTPQRADTPVVGYEERYGAAKVAPLASWSKEAVWEYVGEHGVPVNPLLYKGYTSIGCWPQTRPVGEGEDERAGRWSGLEKTECGLHWDGGDSGVSPR